MTGRRGRPRSAFRLRLHAAKGHARVLRTLHEAGYRVGVVTTKYRHRVEDALERDGLRALVEVIVGADDVPRPKPAPDGLLRAAGSLGIPAGDCVFVGDSEVDARAAQAAGVGFVAVLSGTTAGGVRQVSGEGGAGGCGGDCAETVMCSLHFVW